MKLGSIRTHRGELLGFETPDGRVAELDSAVTVAGYPRGSVPSDMISLIEAGPEVWTRMARAIARGLSAPEDLTTYDLEEVTWRPPVRRPSKIVCLALNNAANKARILQGPDHPAFFIKPWSALIGHREQIICRPEYGRVHPEPELAVIIGSRAKDVAVADALDHVFGYTIHNDITSPTMRMEDTFQYRAIHPKNGDPSVIDYVDSWVSYPGRYKSADTFSALGPWVTTPDELADPHALRVRLNHDGRPVTDDSTGNLTFKTAEVIAFVSRFMTLVPGDVISLGTALAASAAGGAVQNIDLNRLGGEVTVQIDGIGALTNGVAWI